MFHAHIRFSRFSAPYESWRLGKLSRREADFIRAKHKTSRFVRPGAQDDAKVMGALTRMFANRASIRSEKRIRAFPFAGRLLAESDFMASDVARAAAFSVMESRAAI
jgi:hypothetical protein